MENKENKFLKIGKKFIIFAKGIKQKPSSVLLLLLTIILSLPDFQSWTESNHFLYITFLVVLSTVFLWDIYGQGDIIDKLEQKKEGLQQKNEIMMQSLDSLPTDFLELVFKELSFNKADRISLYTHRNDRFVIAARHAKIKSLRTKGRDSYPENEGYIGKAWNDIKNNEDYFFKCDLPDFKADEKEYIKKVASETSLSEDKIKAISMHSRCYYVKVIRKYSEPIGVIVLESLNSRFTLNKKDITKILNGMSGQHLTALIDVNEKANGNREGGFFNE